MEYYYDGTHEAYSEMFAQYQAGAEIRCAKCKVPLIMAVDDEGVRRHGVHHGVYCPTDRRHVMVMIHKKRRLPTAST